MRYRLLVAWILWSAGSALYAADRPNILLIFADDIGYEAVRCYGGLDFETPRLDQMASDGVRFSRAYTSPLCTPSRVSMHTGLYANHHGHAGLIAAHRGTREKVNFDRLTTYAQLLRDEGYLTCVTGKWQLATIPVWPDHMRSAGFDSWCVWQIWHNEQKSKRYWNPILNHDGQVRDDIAERFGPDVLFDYVVDQMEAARDKNQPFLIVHNEMLPHFPMVQTPDDRQAGRPAGLGNMIRYMDKLVGSLLDKVDEMGIRDKTYVVFMGDNGTQEAYFRNPKAAEPGEEAHTRHTTAGKVNGGKYENREAGTHVPLIFWGPPSVPQGHVCDDLVDVVDLLPTFCEIASVDLPGDLHLDGRSIVPQCHGQPGKPRRWVHAATGNAGQSVFDGKWRLVRRGKAKTLPFKSYLNGKYLKEAEFEFFVDARHLPQESPADLSDNDAVAAKARLESFLQQANRPMRKVAPAQNAGIIWCEAESSTQPGG